MESGTSTVLHVVATGTAPLTYQWYQGLSGDTSTPIVGATDENFTTPVLTETVSYWVSVANACGSADSDTAVLTVTVTAGENATLIFDTIAKRWYLDQTDKTDPLVRLEEPGEGVYNQIVGGSNGVAYQYDLEAFQDDDTDIEWDVWPAWFDGEKPRLVKQFGDLAVGVDPGGSVSGITVQPIAEDGSISPASVVVGTGSFGRSEYVVDLMSGGGVLARNFGIRLSGVLQAGDTARPLLFWWEPSFLPKAENTLRRATDWEDLGYVGAKFVQGVIIRANTYGLAKTLSIQMDGGVEAISLTINHDGETQVAYPLASVGWAPFTTELIRIEGGDAVDWMLLDYRFVWEPAPELATQWETQYTSADWPGFGSVRDMVIAYESTDALTVTHLFDGESEQYDVPASSGQYARFYFPFAPNKSKGIKFRITAPTPARIYQKDCSIRTQGWGAVGGYRVQQLFGGPSRISGAQI